MDYARRCKRAANDWLETYALQRLPLNARTDGSALSELLRIERRLCGQRMATCTACCKPCTKEARRRWTLARRSRFFAAYAVAWACIAGALIIALQWLLSEHVVYAYTSDALAVADPLALQHLRAVRADMERRQWTVVALTGDGGGMPAHRSELLYPALNASFTAGQLARRLDAAGNECVSALHLALPVHTVLLNVSLDGGGTWGMRIVWSPTVESLGDDNAVPVYYTAELPLLLAGALPAPHPYDSGAARDMVPPSGRIGGWIAVYSGYLDYHTDVHVTPRSLGCVLDARRRLRFVRAQDASATADG